MESANDLVQHHVSRMESLARPFITQSFKSASDIWEIEVQTIRYQIALREAIGELEEKQRVHHDEIHCLSRKKPFDWKQQIIDRQREIGRIDTLRAILDHQYNLARRFGDSIAWACLGFRRHKIASLSQNTRNPPIPSGDSLRGMLAVAQTAANRGAGFPIIHDITTILRVGDITFVSGDFETGTIEVKTRVLKKTDELTQAVVYAIGSRDDEIGARVHRVLTEKRDGNDSGDKCDAARAVPAPRPTARLRRQLDRMSRAVRYSAAKAGDLQSEDGGTTGRSSTRSVVAQRRLAMPVAQSILQSCTWRSTARSPSCILDWDYGGTSGPSRSRRTWQGAASFSQTKK
jgi:hypothetical protein